MPRYEFVGADPIDHFYLGRIAPGDVVECDEDPGGSWKATKKRPSPTGAEHGSDSPNASEEV